MGGNIFEKALGLDSAEAEAEEGENKLTERIKSSSISCHAEAEAYRARRGGGGGEGRTNKCGASTFAMDQTEYTMSFFDAFGI